MPKHYCKLHKDAKGYDCGHAIIVCTEFPNGVMYVSNNEYSSQVNYCPICGTKAKLRIGEKIEDNKKYKTVKV